MLSRMSYTIDYKSPENYLVLKLPFLMEIMAEKICVLMLIIMFLASH